MIRMTDIDLANKRVLIREDLNVPIKDGEVSSDKRISASLPTIQQALSAGAAVMVMSHLGRPAEGVYDEAYSLRPVSDFIKNKLGIPVRFVSNWLDGVDVQSGELCILENVRFNVGEKSNDDELSKKMAALCDVFVMDAFGSAHRAHASTHGVAKYASIACAGPLLSAELDALGRALENPARPVVAIVGGSKVSTKLTVLESLSGLVDQLIVGGGIANTFIAAAGHSVGKSLYEPDLMALANKLIEAAKSRGVEIPVPTDVVCGKEFSESAKAELKTVNAVADDDMIFDIGPETAEIFSNLLREAGTIIWNGPVGVFEFSQFAEGTRSLAQAIAQSDAFTIAGGGDTLAAIDKYQIEDKLSYVSTGGGAFLEFLEGKELPAVKILKEKGN